MDGIILIDKPKGITSHDVIYKLRKVLKTKKIGHCGTLDPMATGVLVCLVNKATKLSNYLVLDTKEYIATFKLGIATTTQDLEGEIIETKKYINDVSISMLEECLLKFKGKQIQTPSIYSAIKVNGKKLYEYARSNESVEIPQREIEIFKLELLSFENDVIQIKVKCSSGTYIRSLVYDIGRMLNYPAVLIELRRISSGSFNIENSYTLEQISANEFNVLDVVEGLVNYPKYFTNKNELCDIKNGKNINCDMQEDFIVIFENEVIAIYHASVEGIAKMKRGLW